MAVVLRRRGYSGRQRAVGVRGRWRVAALALALAALWLALHKGGAGHPGEPRNEPPGDAGRPEVAPYHIPPRPVGAALQAAPPETESDDAARQGAAPSAGGDSQPLPVEAEAEPEEVAPAEPRPKHFSHPSEQLLAMMLSTPPEGPMPPLPQLDPDDERLNADAIAAITNILVIYEDDGPETERLKEAVAELKAQLAEAVSNGGNVAQVLNEFRDWQNEGAQIRNETIAAINAIEDDEAAAAAFGEANEELAREGIVPIRPEEVGMDTGEEE